MIKAVEYDGPPLELILARNLIAAITTPAFIVDPDGVMTFFNDAAGELMGRRFEETGRLTREEWNEIGPVDDDGRPVWRGDVPMRVTLHEGRPKFGRFCIRTDQDAVIEVQASALPLVGRGAFRGALVTFVAVDAEDRRDADARASGTPGVLAHSTAAQER